LERCVCPSDAGNAPAQAASEPEPEPEPEPELAASHSNQQANTEWGTASPEFDKDAALAGGVGGSFGWVLEAERLQREQGMVGMADHLAGIDQALAEVRADRGLRRTTAQAERRARERDAIATNAPSSPEQASSRNSSSEGLATYSAEDTEYVCPWQKSATKKRLRRLEEKQQ
jgi:hypothetical protein